MDTISKYCSALYMLFFIIPRNVIKSPPMNPSGPVTDKLSIKVYIQDSQKSMGTKAEGASVLIHTVKAMTGRDPNDSEKLEISVEHDDTRESVLSTWLGDEPSKLESPELNLLTRFEICSVCMGS